MGDTVVRATGLGKAYKLGTRGPRYRTLREAIGQAPHALLRALRRRPRDDERFWALRDLTVEVERGEVLGVIGANGSGKSTFLKLLSRITPPTEGKAEIQGRVGSLLEVGTGFHPELTGRDNIYLNGAILGMKRREIDRRFDEIVAFAEAERFLDTPVKHYSSGMHVRLGFAVAAHIAPEILLVDEVLAVGDAAFQQRCLGKMSDVARAGRTVFFVSHNMGAVARLCGRALLLDRGRLATTGPVHAVIEQYLSLVTGSEGANEFRTAPRPDVPFQVLGVVIVNEQGTPVRSTGLFVPLVVRFELALNRDVTGLNLALTISRQGDAVFHTFDTDVQPELLRGRRAAGRYTFSVPLPVGLLGPGTYTVTASMGVAATSESDAQHDVVSFEVMGDVADFRNTSYARRAAVIARIRWEGERT
jgi:lipopolysaccharide transport system ATP-binding protein